MEVNSESGIMSGREPFSVGMQRIPVPVSQPQPAMPNMRMSCAADGTAVYKSVSTFSPSSYYGGFGSAKGTGPTSTAPSTAATVAASGGGDWNSHLPAMPPQGLNLNVGVPVKRKRGRPRKYGPDGTMAMAPMSPATAGAGATPGSGTFSPGSPPETASPASTSASGAGTKKARGRPPGSARKQQMDALGSAGIRFTPHVITVKAGEDVQSKIMSFSHNGPYAVCILSANGAISNVTLHQAATSGGTVTYEGRFEILSLSGSILLSESGGQRNRTGGLSVSLAGPDGRVLGGGVAGLLTAASPVQVVVSSFIAGGRKESKAVTNPPDLVSTPGNLALGGMTGAASPPSRGTISESSSGPGSPLNLSAGACNDINQQGMYNMQWK